MKISPAIGHINKQRPKAGVFSKASSIKDTTPVYIRYNTLQH